MRDRTAEEIATNSDFLAGWRAGSAPENDALKLAPPDWTDEQWRGFRNARKSRRFAATIARRATLAKDKGDRP